MECHKTIAVGVETQVVDRLQFHQRNPAPSIRIHHTNAKPAGGMPEFRFASKSRLEGQEDGEKSGGLMRHFFDYLNLLECMWGRDITGRAFGIRRHPID